MTSDPPTPTQPVAPQSSRPAWSAYVTAIRNAYGITAQHAATAMGVTPQTWAGFEAGTRLRNGQRRVVIPKDDTLHRIADALSMAPDERRRLILLANSTQPTATPWQSRLKAARTSARISQDHAAQAAGVTPSTYREWERRNTAAPRHDKLRRLLVALGWGPDQIDEFMSTVPSDAIPARAPKQPSRPIESLPHWSQYITEQRLRRGLHLAEVDHRLGQQSVVRRFELGGWPRKDGRCSVPSYEWINRVAEALELTSQEAEELHQRADRGRIEIAARGERPFLAELLHEVRRAANLTSKQVEDLVGLPPGKWGQLERGHDTPRLDTLNDVLNTLAIRTALADATRAALRNAPGPAENTKESATAHLRAGAGQVRLAGHVHPDRTPRALGQHETHPPPTAPGEPLS